mmetsp:Transcript_178/g.304  ORF Transcript_178/g.304 Transcript_178/m.304 type:complete len:410 (+) Transcript_178:46-1275(+)
MSKEIELNDITLKEESTETNPTIVISPPNAPPLLDNSHILFQNQLAKDILTNNVDTKVEEQKENIQKETPKISIQQSLYLKCCSRPSHSNHQYRAWHGKHHFLFCGLVMIGPDVNKLVLTLVLFILPSVWYLLTCFPFYVIEFPFYIMLIALFLLPVGLVAPLLSLFAVSTSDPGAVPLKNSHPIPTQAARDALDKSKKVISGSSVPLYQRVNVNGEEKKLKYCYTCKMYRPPRCSHCPACNICIEHFDHHCPYIGTCIGKHNYRLFLCFIYSTWCLLFLGYLFSLTSLALIIYISITKYATEASVLYLILRLILYSIGPILLMIFLVLPFLFLTSLTLFHGMLITRNMTTYEYIKKNHVATNNGCLKNIWIILCSKLPRRKVSYRTPLSSLFPLPMTEVDEALLKSVV